jgi:hypothetical protein
MTKTNELNIAVYRNQFEKVKQLVEIDCVDVNSIENFGKIMETAPHVIVASYHEDNIEILKYLLEKGANPDQCCSAQKNALKSAAKNGNVNALKVLLNYNADLKIEKNGEIALTIASGYFEDEKKCMEMIQLLLSKTDKSMFKFIQKAYDNCMFEKVRNIIKIFSNEHSIIIKEPTKFGSSEYKFYKKCNTPPKHNLDLQMFNAILYIIDHITDNPNLLFSIIIEQTCYSELEESDHDINRINSTINNNNYLFCELFKKYPESKENYPDIYKIFISISKIK